MYRRTAILAAATLLSVFTILPAVQAAEGMWPLFDLQSLDFEKLHQLGLELNAKDIYNGPDKGLWQAVVQLSGGSASFVSPNGLIITNHHVAYSAIQKQSTANKNLLEQGFYARTLAEEIPAIGFSGYICREFINVTDRVKGALSDDMTDRERYDAIEAISKRIVNEAEEEGKFRAEVADFYEGLEYYLITYFEIKDVRIVEVPPAAIGNYGGEIDNWMWPRHTGDFSFLRAYVAPDGSGAEYSEDNVPYKSKHYLKVSNRQLKDGDFAMVIGFPGRTKRYETATDMDDDVNYGHPTFLQKSTDVINIMEDASKADPEIAVRVANDIKSIANFQKKTQGMLDGLRRMKSLEFRHQRESQLAAFLQQHPDLNSTYGQVLPAIDSVYKNHIKSRQMEDALKWLSWRCRYLGFANGLYKWSIEKNKPDMERDPYYMDRNTERRRRRLREAQVNIVPSVDLQVLTYLLQDAVSLPENQRIRGLDEMMATYEPAADQQTAINRFVNDLYANSQLGNLEQRMAMFDMTTEELMATGDKFIQLAAALYEEREELEERSKAYAGAMSKLRPQLVAAYREMQGSAMYPDANGTIRFNFGVVKGYQPADAVTYAPFTTLKGLLDKETGEDPFVVPDALHVAYESGDFGPYFDPVIGDIPVNHLTTLDTTNGNSGSPIFNGKGELIGLCFDGNYEAIAADCQFDDSITRTINVDSRFILYILDKVVGARELLSEMEIVT